MTRLKSLVLGVVFLATVNTSATQIIILGTSQAFYVEADSLVAVPGSTPIRECKIHQTGRIIWTDGGLDLDKKTGFSVQDYFKKNGGMGRAGETLDSIAPKIIPALQKELPVLKSGAPDFYSRTIARGTILTLYAVGIFEHRVEAVEKGFNVVNGKITERASERCEIIGMRNCYLMSGNPAVRDFVGNNPTVFADGPVSAINRIMSVATADDPDYVGGPTSILVVTPVGAQWLQRNNCGDISIP
jgi:hypothetical protein